MFVELLGLKFGTVFKKTETFQTFINFVLSQINKLANLITGIPSKSNLAFLDMKSHIFQFDNNFFKRKSIDEIIDPDKKLSKAVYDTTKSLSFRNISKYQYSNRELKTASLCSEEFLLYEDLNMEKTTLIKDLEFIIDEGLYDN